MIELGCGVDPTFAAALAREAAKHRLRLFIRPTGKNVQMLVRERDKAAIGDLITPVWLVWREQRKR